MGSLIETIQHKAQPNSTLPITQPTTQPTTTTTTPPITGIRKRLSSLSLHLHPTTTTISTTTPFSFPRSKSLSALGHYAKGLWHRSWVWITSKTTHDPAAVFDIEEERERYESPSSRRSDWGGVWRKVRAGMRRIWGGGDRGKLPVTTFRYDSINYKKNFDDGVVDC